MDLYSTAGHLAAVPCIGGDDLSVICYYVYDIIVEPECSLQKHFLP